MSQAIPPSPAELAALMDLALRIAHRLAAAHRLLHYVDELGGVALSAVARALSAHDPAKGKLKPFVGEWIAGEVRHEIKKELRHATGGASVQDAAIPRPAHPAVRAEELAGGVVDALLAVYTGEDLGTHGEAEVLTREAFAALHREIGRLSAEEQRLVELRYWDGLTWEHVARELGIGEKTARERDGRIRERLRDGLIAWDRVRPMRKTSP